MLGTLQTLADFHTVTTIEDNTGWGGGWVAFGLIGAIIIIAGMWKAFEKAKKPGWAAIIPIYNTIVILQIAGRPIWWILLFLLGFIPFVGWIIAFIIAAVVYNDLAKSYKKGVGTTLLLLFIPIIGWPYLGFGDAKYKGPAGPEKARKK